MSSRLESATLFTPGRASYLDECDILQLTEAAQKRADIAAVTYNPNYHDVAVFAGGTPAVAEGWDESLIPPATRREAHLLALPLTERLKAEGKSEAEIGRVVLTQGDSHNSFGDVLISVERGFLDANTFNTNLDHGIDLTAGALHGRRFRRILSLALDIDSSRIRRVPMRDIYGTPDYPRRSSVPASKAVVTELAALAATELVLRGVKAGNLESLKDAEARFVAIATKHPQ
jgi:hypothetical protein